MAKERKKCNFNNCLTLVWDRDCPNLVQSAGDPGADNPMVTSAEEDTGSTLDLHNPMAALMTSLFDLDGADLDDSDCLEVDPEALEEIRLKFAAIEDTEELSLAFLDGEWWHFTELHDELRRACMGSGKTARYVARQSAFEFIVGAATTLAYRGSGPLSTPLNFNTEYPERFAWNEEAIILNEPYRQDALKLTVNLSFMMH